MFTVDDLGSCTVAKRLNGSVCRLSGVGRAVVVLDGVVIIEGKAAVLG